MYVTSLPRVLVLSADVLGEAHAGNTIMWCVVINILLQVCNEQL